MLSLLRLERKQKNSSNPFRIRIFLFLSYSFGIETINTFIHSRSSLENHTRFQTKMGKVYTRFQTKTAQKPYPMGQHIPVAYMGEYPPPPLPGVYLRRSFFTLLVSLRASPPIWASETSLARTRENARESAKPRGAEERRACNDLS